MQKVRVCSHAEGGVCIGSQFLGVRRSPRRREASGVPKERKTNISFSLHVPLLLVINRFSLIVVIMAGSGLSSVLEPM